jgi:hypothetical protein
MHLLNSDSVSLTLFSAERLVGMVLKGKSIEILMQKGRLGHVCSKVLKSSGGLKYGQSKKRYNVRSPSDVTDATLAPELRIK